MHYRDSEEFITIQAAEMLTAWHRVVHRLLGRQQTPQQSPPKYPHFDNSGWVRLPPDWVWEELPPITVVFRRLARERHPPIQYTLVPDEGTLGQAGFEDCLAQIAGRLDAPFAGKIRFELLSEGRREHVLNFDATIGWPVPQSTLR